MIAWKLGVQHKQKWLENQRGFERNADFNSERAFFNTVGGGQRGFYLLNNQTVARVVTMGAKAGPESNFFLVELFLGIPLYIITSSSSPGPMLAVHVVDL